jgi:hypothetical protein
VVDCTCDAQPVKYYVNAFGDTMKLEELKQAYLAGDITHMSMTHKLKQVSSELNELYPQQGDL